MIPSMKVFAVEKRSFPRRHATTIAAACAAALLAGCANTPYQQPALNLPAQWQHAAEGQTQTAADATYGDRWWTAFGDEQLNTLIDLALQRNNNLAAAAYTVRNAQLEAGNAAGDRLPTPSAGLNYNRSRELTGAENTNRSYNANLGVSWEIDLWGKLAAAQRRAEWEARATEQDRQATAQALVATVATIYWELATLNHKITSQQQSVTTAAKTLEPPGGRHFGVGCGASPPNRSQPARHAGRSGAAARGKTQCPRHFV